MFLAVELHKQREVNRMRKLLKLSGSFKTRDGVKNGDGALEKGKRRVITNKMM